LNSLPAAVVDFTILVSFRTSLQNVNLGLRIFTRLYNIVIFNGAL